MESDGCLEWGGVDCVEWGEVGWSVMGMCRDDVGCDGCVWSG
jgi:hypothetical protein